ncbi:hypothetical protein [Stieleria varia]|uniref:AhpC/TSA family protein n=1 Tax=Stieleria varia TaxID=2528005 RepID=A0A5C6A4P0_9BACT|nr:hypothetical protein [Stieleria varia]TWT94439.1 hypothetical protein Pla52n_52600 [Stieleria varia]
MRNIVICVAVLVMVCSVSFAQDAGNEKLPDNASGNQADKPAEMRRQQQARTRTRPPVEVKDPAGFIKPKDKDVFSGPQAGEKLPSFKAIGIAGEQSDKELDLVEIADGKPMILIFQDDTPAGIRGLFGFARAIDAIKKQTDKQLTFASVFLDDDATKISANAKRYPPNLTQLLTLAVSPDGRSGPGAYGLDRNIPMTILIVNEGKVLHNFAMTQSMAYPDPHVLGAVAELIGAERETVAKWINDAQAAQQRMRPAPAR